MIINFAVIFVFLISTGFAQSNQGGLLLDAFQNYCVDDYSLSERKLNAQVSALKSTINNLKTRQECQFNDVLSAYAGSYETALSRYGLQNSAKFDRAAHERKIISYTQMIDSGSYSTTETDYLKSEIFNSQLGLVRLKDAELRRFTNFGSQAEIASQELVSGVSKLLLLNQKNPDCYSDSQQLASLVSAATGSAAAFLSPVSSLAINTVSQLGLQLSEVFRNRKYNKGIKRLNDENMILAMQCSSLSLSRNYCDADNSIKLIQKYNETKLKKTQSLIGIDLLGRRLINTDAWLKFVVSGSTIRQEGNFDTWKERQSDVDELRIIIKGLDTFKFEIERRWQFLNDNSQRSQAITQGIADIPWALGAFMGVDNNGNSKRSAVFDVRDPGLLKYQLIDPSLKAIPNCPVDCNTPIDSNSGQCMNLAQYVNNVQCRDFTLDDWELAMKRAKDIADLSFLNAQSQLRRVKTLDPMNLFFKANFENGEYRNVRDELQNVNGILLKIKNYLVGEKELNIEHPHFDAIDDIDAAMKLTTQVSQMIVSGQNIERELHYPPACSPIFEENYITGQTCEDECKKVCTTEDQSDCHFECIPICKNNYSTRVKPALYTNLKERTFALADCISQMLDLDDRGNLVYFDKLKSIVQYELEARLKDDDFSEHIQDILLVSRRELVENLSAQYQGSLAIARDQLGETKDKTKRALKTYWGLFEKSLVKILTKYDLGNYDRKSLCMRALTYLPIEKDSKLKNRAKNKKQMQKDLNKFLSQIYPYCKDTVLNHYSDGPTIKWIDFVKVDGNNYSYSDKPEEQRLCISDIYSRRVKIFENKDLESF